MDSSKISLDDAMNVTGLSRSTLERFSEAGYLSTTEINNGLFYLVSELESTFAIKVPIKEKKEVQKRTPQKVERNIETPTEDSKSETTQIEVEKIESQSNNNFKLSKVIEMQESILIIKDSQISDLKEQNKWLQERVEKLEDKAEKDQLLLLSESRTVARLIELQRERKGPFKLALEWMGLREEDKSKDKTIDMDM